MYDGLVVFVVTCADGNFQAQCINSQNAVDASVLSRK